MPELPKQYEDHEWLAKTVGPISGVPPELGLFDYQKYITIFVKTNLNYLHGTKASCYSHPRSVFEYRL